MSSFDVILVLLVGVVTTHGIGRALNNRITLPIIQIGAGALIGTTPDRRAAGGESWERARRA